MLISSNSGSKRSKFQHYNDVYIYQKNLIVHNFLLRQVMLERRKVI